MLTKTSFNKIFADTIIGGGFFEGDDYYRRYRDRYFNTLRYIERTSGLARGLRVLDVGSGQFACLLQELADAKPVILDVDDAIAEAVSAREIPFVCHSLAADSDPPLDRASFDVIIMAEVVEHLPTPPYQSLERLRPLLSADGSLFVTTPNVARPRNIAKLLVHGGFHQHWEVPDPPRPLGHVREYSLDETTWQCRRAGYTRVTGDLVQLSMGASSLGAKAWRYACAPLRLYPKLRDSIIVRAQP